MKYTCNFRVEEGMYVLNMYLKNDSLRYILNIRMFQYYFGERKVNVFSCLRNY